MRGVCSAFYQTCNNGHKKGNFFNVCMSTNKSLKYLDNQSRPPTTADKALDRYFFIGAIFDILNEVKNKQQINIIVKEANAKLSVTFNTNGTNICYKIECGAPVNEIPENQIEICKQNQE